MLKKSLPVSLRPLLFMLWNGAVGRVIGDAVGAEIGNCCERPESADPLVNQTAGSNSRGQRGQS